MITVLTPHRKQVHNNSAASLRGSKESNEVNNKRKTKKASN
jgi:hypothetical protein